MIPALIKYPKSKTKKTKKHSANAAAAVKVQDNDKKKRGKEKRPKRLNDPFSPSKSATKKSKVSKSKGVKDRIPTTVLFKGKKKSSKKKKEESKLEEIKDKSPTAFISDVDETREVIQAKKQEDILAELLKNKEKALVNIFKRKFRTTVPSQLPEPNNKIADELTAQGEELLRQNYLFEAQSKFLTAYQYAKETKALEYIRQLIAEVYNRMGLEYSECDNFSAADECFAAARRYNYKDKTRKMIPTTKVKRNKKKLNAHNENIFNLLIYQVRVLLQDSIIQKLEKNYQESLKKLWLAKQKLQEALEYKTDTNTYIINCLVQEVDNTIYNLRSVLNLAVK